MQYEELTRQVGDALESGRVRPQDVERLLRGRAASPGVSGVLVALGAATVFIGVALAYTLAFDDLSNTAKVVTPFLFPLVALAAAVALHWSRQPAWTVTLAGLVGYAALALAYLAAKDGLSTWDQSRFGLVAGATATAIVLAMYRLLGDRRMTGWGLTLALPALLGFTADVLGLSDRADRILLAEAIVAAGWGIALHARRSAWARYPLRAAALLIYLASFLGIFLSCVECSEPGFTGWHALLTVAVVVTFVAAAALDVPGLTLVGLTGSLLWVAIVIDTGQDGGGGGDWPLAIVGLGGLLMVAAVVPVLLRRRRAQRSVRPL